MANPSDRDALVRLLAGLGPKPTSLADLVNTRATSTPPNPFSPAPGIFGGLAATPPSTLLGGLYAMPVDRNPPPSGGLANALWPYLGSSFSGPGIAAPPLKSALPVATAVTKRKGFFSFHYDDIMRVNNVRKAWTLAHPDREIKRNFYDRSLWESTKRTNPEGLKKLIRDGMTYSSTVCVMVGTGTWARPWVRYEIARAVVDKKGLLAIHINGIRRHDQHRQADQLGMNPLDFIGIYKAPTGSFYLYEKSVAPNRVTGVPEWQWQPFKLYSQAVPLPKYMAAPSSGYLLPLSTGTVIYDYAVDRGSDNLGAWIDAAAKRAGR
jgi:hypothetical protein